MMLSTPLLLVMLECEQIHWIVIFGHKLGLGSLSNMQTSHLTPTYIISFTLIQFILHRSQMVRRFLLMLLICTLHMILIILSV